MRAEDIRFAGLSVRRIVGYVAIFDRVWQQHDH
jgi:hypothetical protein